MRQFAGMSERHAAGHRGHYSPSPAGPPAALLCSWATAPWPVARFAHQPHPPLEQSANVAPVTVCQAPSWPLPRLCRLQDIPSPRGASPPELDALLAAVSAGRLCRVRSTLQPHFSQADLMAAETRALLAGDAAVAALLLRRTRRLPVLVAGQCGSVPDLDAASAATIRRWGGWEAKGAAQRSASHCGMGRQPGMTAAVLATRHEALPAGMHTASEVLLESRPQDSLHHSTTPRFVSDGGLAAAGGWGGWGADHLYSALELGMEQTAAALLAAGVQLAGTPPGGICLHALAESTHAWDRCARVGEAPPSCAQFWAALGALDAQHRKAQKHVTAHCHRLAGRAQPDAPHPPESLTGRSW